MKCPSCDADVMEIDVKCASCGAALGATGAHRMVGQVVLDTYELVDVLGQGGMSVVFKARHKMTEQEVALKILPPELAAHSQVKSRFLEEARALAALDHPNIVHLYNFGQENSSFVLAMQFVQGKTWERMILENERLDWKTSCKITIDVLKALEYAHGRGVIHRDMKPSNVLVRSLDGSATVMDFGIAKMTTSTKLTATGQTMGTVRYMSPEQVRGQEVDLRTDIYSLGATLFESLVGDTPFDGSTHFEIMTKHLSEEPKRPSELGIELPRLVEDALMKCLEKRAEDRFDNARDLRKILEAALREHDVGLTETQRLGRDIMNDLRATAPEKPAAVAAARPATASDLADALEPDAEEATPRRRRAVWPWLLALAVLGGGGATAALLLKRGHGYHPVTAIKGVELTSGKQFADLHVLVETDGKVTPDEVAAVYRETLEQLRVFDPKVEITYKVIDEIVALPAAALCEPSAYPVEAPPPNCRIARAAHAIGLHGSHNLYVADDRAGLREAMRTGVGNAICEFQPGDPKNEADRATLKMVCDVAQRFAGAK